MKKWLKDNILTIISLFMPAITAISTYVWAKINETLTPLNIVLIVALLLCSIVLLILFFYKRSSFKTFYYKPSLIKADYEILEKSIEYKLMKTINITSNNSKNKSNVEYTLDFSNTAIIKCCARRLDRINGKFLWTGKSDANLPKTRPVMDVRLQQKKPGIWTFYDIILDRCLLRGNTKKIVTYHKSIPLCKTSSPFVSSETDEPTKLLKFNIDLGEDYAGKRVFIETFRSGGSKYVLESVETTFDDCGKLTYIIRPKRFRYYMVHWEW